MKQLRVFIVDDEQQAINHLANKIDQLIPEAFLVGTSNCCLDALEKLNSLSIDLLFLDIELGTSSGFKLLEMLPNINFKVVFVTAHSKYALKAIKFSAFDFLLKPIVEEELLEVFIKFKAETDYDFMHDKRFDLLKVNLKEQQYSKIIVPDVHGFILLPISEIIYCQADKNYTTFTTNTLKKNIVSSKPIRHYSSLIEEQGFFRINQSFLINLEQIGQYIKGEGGTVIMRNGYEIQVPRRKKREFLELFQLN